MSFLLLGWCVRDEVATDALVVQLSSRQPQVLLLVLVDDVGELFDPRERIRSEVRVSEGLFSHDADISAQDVPIYTLKTPLQTELNRAAVSQ